MARGVQAGAAVFGLAVMLAEAGAGELERLELSVNRAEFLVGEPLFCLLRVGEPGAGGTLRRLRCEYRVVEESGRVLGVSSSEGEGWCPVRALPLVRSRRELMFTLWRIGCGGPYRGEPTLITHAPGRYTLEVRARWWMRLVEFPWVVSNRVAFEVRESTEGIQKGREFADLALSVFVGGTNVTLHFEEVREFFWEAPAAYKPYAAWLVVQFYRPRWTDMFEGKLPRTAYGDLVDALEAMRGAKVADFPNEFEEAVRVLELLQLWQRQDLKCYREALAEYTKTYGYCGLFGVGWANPLPRLLSKEFKKRIPELLAMGEESVKDPRTRIERAAALSRKGRLEADRALADLVQLFETDPQARADAVAALADEKVPEECKSAVVGALVQTRFPERDMFVRDCAMGKYGDDLKWPAVQSLKSINRRDAERAVLANLEDLLDGYFAPAPVFDVAVELKILSARPILKALADEGNEAARRAYEELEKAAGGEGSERASGKETETR